MPTRSSLYEIGSITVYYRFDPDNRLLIGGRSVQRDVSSPDALRYLTEYAMRLWPMLRGVRWTHGWSGRLAYTPDHYPHIHEPDEAVLVCLGYNGRGCGDEFGHGPGTGPPGRLAAKRPRSICRSPRSSRSRSTPCGAPGLPPASRMAASGTCLVCRRYATSIGDDLTNCITLRRLRFGHATCLPVTGTAAKAGDVQTTISPRVVPARLQRSGLGRALDWAYRHDLGTTRSVPRSRAQSGAGVFRLHPAGGFLLRRRKL